jgi:proteasome lid subunit RPN8/RPN11
VRAEEPYPAAVLARIRALCEASPDEEACGVVLRRGGALEVLPLENVARDRRDRFELAPLALLRVQRALDADGGAIAAVWHSHVEAAATFSARDREGALVDGRPVLPGAEQLVVSVRGGRAVEVRRYVLAGREYVEVEV